MTTLEINTNNEWLIQLSPVDFEPVEESDRDDAAKDFTNGLWNHLESAGFDVIGAKGQRSTCHGWNGANTFPYMDGPVGSFDQLTDDEAADVVRCIDEAEKQMLEDWTPAPVEAIQ